MDYADLRGWLKKADSLGELKVIRGADWNGEIGAIMTVVGDRVDNAPALLFDDIKGYPRGYRVLTSSMDSHRRIAMTLGMSLDYDRMGFVAALRHKLRDLKNIPPRVVKTGPVMENVITGQDIDVLKFPVPKWFELDGARYIGTGSVDITRDPDEGWVNLGTYRVMVHDDKTLGFYASPGKHGRIHREKWFARGEPCKVAISVGHEPLMYLVGSMEIPWGVCEYDVIGGLRGEPVDVIEGPYTGLPIPANAEIVIEGESIPGEERVEGPFGEWTGYYASDARPEPVIHVKTIMHRRDPILNGLSPRMALKNPIHTDFMKPAQIWNELEAAGVPDVRGVWQIQAGIIVVSIKQRYPGHARQAGLVATGCHSGAYMGRYVIVVDDDINPSDANKVLWALGTRTDPAKSNEIIRRCWSTALDPAIPKWEKGHNSREIIEACRPFEWINDFPPVVGLSAETERSTVRKWGKELGL